MTFFVLKINQLIDDAIQITLFFLINKISILSCFFFLNEIKRLIYVKNYVRFIFIRIYLGNIKKWKLILIFHHVSIFFVSWSHIYSSSAKLYVLHVNSFYNLHNISSNQYCYFFVFSKLLSHLFSSESRWKIC